MGNTYHARQRQQVIEQTAIGCLLCWHFGATIEAAEQPAAEARRVADVAACEAWNMPSAAIAITRRRLNAGYRYLKVKCAGCRENNMVDLANHPAPTWSIACAASRARCSAAIPTSAAHLVDCDSKVTPKDDGEPCYPTSAIAIEGRLVAALNIDYWHRVY